jgi:GGDEF domain-containing protein
MESVWWDTPPQSKTQPISKLSTKVSHRIGSIMNGSMEARLRDIGYARARRLFLITGLGVLLITAAVMYARGVDTIEVAGTLFFMVVFIGFLFYKIRGGIIAGVVAALWYASLRYPAIQAVGLDRFIGLIASRGVAYVCFGVLGGWATDNLEASIQKLELYDQIEDTTGLYNARFFVQDTDLEMSRSNRYHTIFSVAVAEIPDETLESLGRKRSGTLRQLGRTIADSVRTVDRAVFGSDDHRHRLAVVLPETGPEGARIFADRLAQRVSDYLGQRGAAVAPGVVGGVAVSFPEDGDALETLRAQFAEIDRREHPEASETAAPPDPQAPSQ